MKIELSSQRRKMAAVTSRGNQQWCYADVHFPLATLEIGEVCTQATVCERSHISGCCFSPPFSGRVKQKPKKRRLFTQARLSGYAHSVLYCAFRADTKIYPACVSSEGRHWGYQRMPPPRYCSIVRVRAIVLLLGLGFRVRVKMLISPSPLGLGLGLNC